jgi:hypothetical protein
VQVKNRLTDGKAIRVDHGLQMLYVILIKRIKFQDRLLGTRRLPRELSTI